MWWAKAEWVGRHLDPLLIGEAGPHMVGLSDDGLVRLQDHACLVHIHVEGSQDEDQPGEGGVGGNGLQPVVVDVEQHHLGLCGLQNEVTELLNLEGSLHKHALGSEQQQQQVATLQYSKSTQLGRPVASATVAWTDTDKQRRRQRLQQGFKHGMMTAALTVAGTRERKYLEGELQLGAGDDNVGEIQQVDLQRVQHTLSTHNDALGLLLHWQ